MAGNFYTTYLFASEWCDKFMAFCHYYRYYYRGADEVTSLPCLALLLVKM